MSTYHQSYCPYCDHCIRSTPHPVSYGNPIKLCPACGKKYIDSYCTEPALREYKPLSLRWQFKTSIPFGFTLVFLVALIVSTATKNSKLAWTIGAIYGPILWVLFSLALHRLKKSTEHQRLKQWQESDQRLRDPKHAAALKFYGYNVPPKYLPSGYWKDREALTYPGATTATPRSRAKKNPPPHMPSGSENYY